jgi:hypothetical protein
MLAYDHAQIDFTLFKVILDRKRDDLTTNSKLLGLVKTEIKWRTKLSIFAMLIARLE